MVSCTNFGASLDAFEGKYHKCEGVGHRQADCTSRPDVRVNEKDGGTTPMSARVKEKVKVMKTMKGKGKGEYGKGDYGKGKGWGGKDGGK